MDSVALNSTSAAQSRAQTQIQLVQKMTKMNVDADRQMVAVIEANAANARAVAQESATAPGVGTRVDRQV